MDNINGYLLVNIDNRCDYVPVISSATNFVDLFQKCVVLPFIDKAAFRQAIIILILAKKALFAASS